MNQPTFIILLIEDDPNDIDLVSHAFSKASLPGMLRSVSTAEEAIAYLSGDGAFADRDRHPLPSLILLDLKLPGRSGFECIEWLKKTPAFKGIPVIVLTSSRESVDIRRAYDLGATSYMVKPVGFDELLALVKTIGAYWALYNRFPEAPRP